MLWFGLWLLSLSLYAGAIYNMGKKCFSVLKQQACGAENQEKSGMVNKKIKEFDNTLFLEEIWKRVSVPESEVMAFLELWEHKTYKRNAFISVAGEIPRFSIFVLKGCLRQYTVSDKGDETIVYFAEEKHFIGDLPNMRSKSVSNFYFQAIEPCELLTLSAQNWQKAFVQFPWWTDAHITGYQKWTASLQQQIADMNTQTGDER